MKYKINNHNKINDKIIRDDVFQKEMTNYVIEYREGLADHIINWIGESKSESDVFSMKEDLKYLMSLKDEFILSSISTNEYIRENTEEGQKILAEIMDL